ncbi:helix-turn-helix domain-containing protein [Desulfopila aestuarii]|uniref:Helix-turn-helix n=1 Tax=Desulfopila aestuarii DSM 18488 TaxID=1121416 RepID=A0A1M7XZI0_9BACT|nr:helix-turn-helix transcriptional regulator [Desulfopila aestuarii]SHO44549.1 Helix-turn-helix [Desulfopila aestuarii DSM 18488]
MENNDFQHIRKRLGKTQKEMAVLLGTSLKAVSSYEQGWRGIPTHVERQMLFLLSQKMRQQQPRKNCWETKRCPERKKKNCPAWEFDAGHLCWFINGTFCESTTKTNWQEKISVCRQCQVMKGLS